ncbi:fibroin light chain-like [Hyposmocoma kahamanoa]|uniref:fibroin light chain-like n=1 Tax=Hyposmocoma kahamanoa TaxID=1477025 RepID=UPI000E6D5D4D|nr:fibroin light chain-like [Hyposmocoma kahamanoa]
MLPLVLVLFAASSALAAPSVSVTTSNINDIAPLLDNGALVSSYLTDRAFELIDGGDTNIYILTLQQILNDLANQPDPRTQAVALAQTISVLGALGTGFTGFSCDAAAVINAAASGNGEAAAARAYASRLASYVDVIAKLAVNPNSVRNTFGLEGSCPGYGRVYRFEDAWEIILNNASPYTVGLFNEEYCAAKRLYQAFNVRSNAVGAAATAAAMPSVVNIVQNAVGPLSNFLRAAISGGNCSAAAATARAALLR